MYLDHFGLSEPPFRITPHTDFFFSGANRGSTLDALIYAITHDEGIVKVSGEVGSGKTMLCRVLMERLPESVITIYLANPSLSREDILYALLEELNLAIPEPARAASMLRVLQDHLIQCFSDGRQVVVLIDEAHAMPVETLEEIRLLSNLESNRSKLLQLVLFGQPELNEILARSDMRQLKERITHNFMLEPLIRDDIAHYVDFRLRAAGYKGPPLFAPAAIKAIAQTSLGLTRRINILADKGLLAAFAAGTHQVGLREIRAAIKDCDFSTATYLAPAPRIGPMLAAGAIALAALIAIAGFLWHRPDPSPSEPDKTTTAMTVAPQPPPPPIATPPAPGTFGPRTLQALEAGKAWLGEVPDRRWFLQLFATDAKRPENIENFLEAAEAGGAAPEAMRVYASSLSGRERLGVIYGDYENRAEATAAIATLPQVLRTANPYPRQAGKLR